MERKEYECSTRTRKMRTTRTMNYDGSETIETVDEIIEKSVKISKEKRDEKDKISPAQRERGDFYYCLKEQTLANIISHYFINIINHLKQLICNMFL